jgi:hypothetical protein
MSGLILFDIQGSQKTLDLLKVGDIKKGTTIAIYLVKDAGFADFEGLKGIDKFGFIELLGIFWIIPAMLPER